MQEIHNPYWPLESRANSSFTRSGSDNSDLNTYTYNEDGYRGDSIKNPIHLLAVGCSHTEGVDVSDNETWPYYTAKSLGITHVNAGFTGRSNDYISRTVVDLVKKYQPKIVSVMYTYTFRREYWCEYGPQAYSTNKWGYFKDFPKKWEAITELVNPIDDKYNFIKNHTLVTMACKLANTKLVWNGTFIGLDIYDENRFDGNYKPEFAKHATPEQNKKYSEELVGFLKSNSYI